MSSRSERRHRCNISPTGSLLWCVFLASALLAPIPSIRGQGAGTRAATGAPSGQKVSGSTVTEGAAARRYLQMIAHADSAVRLVCFSELALTTASTYVAEHRRESSTVAYGTAKEVVSAIFGKTTPFFSAQRLAFQLIEPPVAFARIHGLIAEQLTQMDGAIKAVNTSLAEATTVADGARMTGALELRSMELRTSIDGYELIRKRLVHTAQLTDSASVTRLCQEGEWRGQPGV